MSVKTQRQDARRRAREARSERERARKAREKRVEDLAVTVLTSMDAVAERERLAGEALRVMVEDEGLSLREAVSWCGDEVSVRTAARFKRLVADETGEADDEAGDQARDEPDGGREDAGEQADEQPGEARARALVAAASRGSHATPSLEAGATSPVAGIAGQW